MKLKNRLAAAACAALLALSLSGCWDMHEINKLFIVTAVSMDKSAVPGQIDLSVQLAKIQQTTSQSSGDASSDSQSTIIAHVTSGSMAEGIKKLDMSGSRKLFLHHNQAILFGRELARDGIKRHMDSLLRDEESRMEIPILLVDGLASEALATQMEQDPVTGMYLSRVMNGMGDISVEYRVRLLDFLSRLVDGSSAPIAPIVSVFEIDGKNALRVEGFGVFKEDKLVGELSSDEARAYVWTMGDVNRSGFVAQSGADKATFIISKLDTKRKVSLKEDGNVKVKLEVDAKLKLTHLEGFDEVTIKELKPMLEEMAKKEIEKGIKETFARTQVMGTDIYRFGVSVHQKYPKEWEKMKSRWDDYYKNIELETEVKARMPELGMSTISLEMQGVGL